MNRLLIFFLLFWMSNILLGQTKDTTKFVVVDVMPEFPGGSKNLFETIKQNLKYPESAMNENIEGVVFITFIIDTVGNVSDVKVLKGIRNDMDQEAIRIGGLLQGWTPGMIKMKKVRVQYNLPIRFTLNDNTNKDKQKEKQKKKN
jgi:periplasmic protein TonB